MPVVRYHRFEQWMIDTIKEALLFLKSKIKQYGENQKKAVSEVHHSVIDSDIEKEIAKIDGLDFFLDVQVKRFVFEMDEAVFQRRIDVVRSALEIYLRDTKEAKAKSGSPGFDSKIQEIERVIGLDAVKKGRADLYDKYYEPARLRESIQVFLSYSHNDKTLAGKIAAFLRGYGIEVFLAHEDIRVSEEWRNEISRQLKSCDVLLALLTPSFEESVWANQEAGYVLGRKRKVVPLILEGTDIKKFGFLESLQGIPMKKEKTEQSFKEILDTIAE